MRVIVFILFALSSLFLSILCFGTLLASCAGHPPATATDIIGIWILPTSLLGGGTFFYLSLFFWKARQKQPPGLLKKEANLLPRKVLIFIFSFIMASISFIFLMGLKYFEVIETNLTDWTIYIYYALSTGLSIYLGTTVYKKFVTKFTSIQNPSESV